MTEVQHQAGSGARGRQMDFVPARHTAPESAGLAAAQATLSSQTTSTLGGAPASSTDTSRAAEPAVPVTSAKAAINAMYAKPADPPAPRHFASAREAVNAAAKQQTTGGPKSAANLHHGSIQKSMESTKVSASALLKVAKAPQPDVDEVHPADSFDPLAKPTDKSSTADDSSEHEIPVIRTSLKLGAAARPKKRPVILPPGSRMARQARPVNQPRPKINQLLSRRPSDAQIIYPNTLTPAQNARLGSGAKGLPAPKNDNVISVPVIAAGEQKALPTGITAPGSDIVRRPKNRMVDLISPHLSKPVKFRPAPKGYTVNKPRAAAPGNSYVMTTPPKIKLAKPNPERDNLELGVIQNYRPEPTPAVIGDFASVNKVKSAEIVETPAPEKQSTKSKENSSFGRKANKSKPVDNNRYTLGGQSPFINTVNVEKRPLSDKISHDHPKIERPAIPEKETKLSRKNVYQKKQKPAKADLPTRPTVIIPSSRRSKLPLFFLVLFTIILGAAVGAAAYLCFFQ